MGLAIDVSKVKLHFRVNVWPSFWGPKTLAKPVSPRRASPVILDERKEGWGDVKRRFGAVEPVMFAYVHRSHLWSFTMARKPCFVLFDVVV